MPACFSNHCHCYENAQQDRGVVFDDCVNFYTVDKKPV